MTFACESPQLEQWILGDGARCHVVCMKENRPEDRAVYSARRGRAQVTCDHLSAAVRYSHARRYPHGDPGRGRAARARRRASRRPLIPHRQAAEIFNAGSGLWVQRAARLKPVAGRLRVSGRESFLGPIGVACPDAPSS